MHKLLLAFCLLAVPAFAEKQIIGVKAIDTSASNIGPNYAALSGSVTFSKAGHHITVINTASTRAWVSYSKGSCASGDTDEMLVPNNSSNTHYHAYIPSGVCFRSGGADIVSGSLIAEVWE
mgnify:CR=1 FL=1